MSSPARVRIIGIGSVLTKDDAFGPTVVETLRAEYDVPEGVSIQELGTPTFDLIPWISDIDTLIVVDTVVSKGDPGELRFYRREEVLKYSPYTRINPHDPGLKAALLTADFIGNGPREVYLVGVIPTVTHGTIGLTEPVRAAIPGAVQAIVDELDRLGLPATRKARPGRPDLWWEQEPATVA